MQQLDEVIQSYFPSDQIKKTLIGRLDQYGGPILLRTAFNFPGVFTMPLTMIETDKHVFFDIRQSKLGLLVNMVNLLPISTGLIVGIFVYYVSGGLLESLAGFGIGAILMYLWLKLQTNIFVIQVLDKRWIDKTKIDQGTYSLSGISPKGINYSLAYFISPEAENKLSFIDKILKNLIYKNFLGKSLTEENFSYSIIKI